MAFDLRLVHWLRSLSVLYSLRRRVGNDDGPLAGLAFSPGRFWCRRFGIEVGPLAGLTFRLLVFFSSVFFFVSAAFLNLVVSVTVRMLTLIFYTPFGEAYLSSFYQGGLTE